jgi:hypothetical protein
MEEDLKIKPFYSLLIFLEMKAKLIFSGLILMAVTTFASAQNNGAGQRQNNGACQGTAYVDDNKNGMCDRYENRNPSVSGSKGSGYGKCNKQGKGQQNCQGQGSGRNYKDANNNGICDRRESAAPKSK